MLDKKRLTTKAHNQKKETIVLMFSKIKYSWVKSNKERSEFDYEKFFCTEKYLIKNAEKVCKISLNSLNIYIIDADGI